MIENKQKFKIGDKIKINLTNFKGETGIIKRIERETIKTTKGNNLVRYYYYVKIAVENTEICLYENEIEKIKGKQNAK